LDRDDDVPRPVPDHPRSSRWILGLIGLFLAAGAVVLVVFGQPSKPIPPEIAADPLLARGREIYLERCVACHGAAGQGDGPLAKSLTPRPRNLANDPWKHGEKPEQVLAVLANGVKDAQMPAWAGTYGPEDLKAVAAYVYQIARKPVPEALRK
jgi:mono/diheme cytochrome c family protein